ncbi:MAG: ribonuclease HII [Sphaerochaeta sp.]
MALICGVDEAGRGPLAGPVVAAAVILPSDFPTHLLNDSKKLTPKKRKALELLIKERALCYSVKEISNTRIDEINILQATLEAMRLAVEELQQSYEIACAYIDGNKIPPLSCNAEAVIKGDQSVSEIMAASILAKEERDRIMTMYHHRWPEYNFAQHKGYPTKAHKEALRTYGPTPIHRLSFQY